MVAPLVAAVLTPFVTDLFKNGLTLLGQAVLKKGKDVVEEKLGTKLDDKTPEQLRQIQEDNQEVLNALTIEKMKLELEGEKVEQGNVTDRWKADMLSDSWLSKNVRPLVLVYLTLVVTLMAGFSSQLQIVEAWIELLGTAYVTTIVAYFGSRGVEKWRSKR